MITIYHLGLSQSDRIVWLMEELELPYKLEWFDRGPDFLAPEEYRALHPTATAPTIRDGDLVLPESLAIVEYISNRHADGRLSVSPQADNYADYLYWMQLNNNLQSTFFAKLAAGDAANDPANSMMVTMNRRQNAYYQYLNDRLGDVPFLAGSEFTLADIMAMFPITMLSEMMGQSMEGLDNLQAYIQRVSERPAYIKAQALAGPSAQRPS